MDVNNSTEMSVRYANDSALRLFRRAHVREMRREDEDYRRQPDAGRDAEFEVVPAVRARTDAPLETIRDMKRRSDLS
jgi:hypothetical protein